MADFAEQVRAQERRIRLALGDDDSARSAPHAEASGAVHADDDHRAGRRLLFGFGALFAAIRLVKGPTQIDRAVALDVLLAIVVGVIVLLAAVSGSGSPW